MLDVQKSRELQATILALRSSRRDIRQGINKSARQKLNPLWKHELDARAHNKLERRVILAGARVAATDRGVTLWAANSTRALRGGLVPKWDWPGVEFGANPRRVTVTQRSRSGRSYTRPLWINRQFQARQQDGMIAFDAASVTGTRLVALWVHNTVDELAKIPAVEVTA